MSRTLSDTIKKKLFPAGLWLCLTFPLCATAQSFSARYDSLLRIQHHQAATEPVWLFHGRSALLKWNPVSLVFGGLMYTYQKVISTQLSTGCLYEPGCSGFTHAAIRQHGIIKGIALGVDRLQRCNYLVVKANETVADPKTGKIMDAPAQY